MKKITIHYEQVRIIAKSAMRTISIGKKSILKNQPSDLVILVVLVHLLAVAELVLPPARAPVQAVFAPTISHENKHRM